MRCLPLADDCGVSPSNTQSIMHCIDSGALRGTSILASGDAVALAAVMLAERMRDNPRLKAGVHLNLLEGRCTAQPSSVPMLADRKGRFLHSLPVLCLRLARLSPKGKQAMLAQITLEWQAQIDLVTGLLREQTPAKDVIPYLDGHQHVHAIPALRPALIRILEANSVLHVRVPEEPRYTMPASASLFVVGTLRRELLSAWGRSLRPFLSRAGVRCPDFFLGAFCSGSMTSERLKAGLAKVHSLAGKANPLVEIMTHPGGYVPDEARPDDDGFARFYAAPEREQEKQMLLSREYRDMLARFDMAWNTAPA